MRGNDAEDGGGVAGRQQRVGEVHHYHSAGGAAVPRVAAGCRKAISAEGLEEVQPALESDRVVCGAQAADGGGLLRERRERPSALVFAQQPQCRHRCCCCRGRRRAGRDGVTGRDAEDAAHVVGG